MSNENSVDSDVLAGTILRVPLGRDDWDASRGGCYAKCTVPDVRDVMVDFAGDVIYAVRGTPGDLVWWFAGTGEVREP